MKRRKFAALFALVSALSLGSACNNNEFYLSEEETNTLIYYLTGDKLSVAGRGGYFARLWYVSPNINSDSENTEFILPATANLVSSNRNKIILVMGWQVADQDEGDLPAEEILKERLFGTWSTFFASTEYATKNTSFDFFAFTYLSSNQISINGARFRNRMDSLFASESGTVNILAHSMGGLVSRYALYEGNDPAYLNKIVTLGTPFHGSPWASPQFQAGNVLGTLAGFFTGTAGGAGLAYNNINGDLAGASNAELVALNSLTDRDSKMAAYYYGTVTNSSPSFDTTLDSALSAACTSLGSTGGTESDCIVPSLSAQRNTTDGKRVDALNHGHTGVAMGNSALRSVVLANF